MEPIIIILVLASVCLILGILLQLVERCPRFSRFLSIVSGILLAACFLTHFMVGDRNEKDVETAMFETVANEQDLKILDSKDSILLTKKNEGDIPEILVVYNKPTKTFTIYQKYEEGDRK